jgi:hypothetical protein
MMLGYRAQQLKHAKWFKNSTIDYHVQLAQSEGTCYLIFRSRAGNSGNEGPQSTT